MSDAELPENKKTEAETETDAEQTAAQSQVTATETSPSQETNTQLPAKQTETLPAKQTETLPAKQTDTLQQTTEPNNRDPNRNQSHIDNEPECVLSTDATFHPSHMPFTGNASPPRETPVFLIRQ